MQDVYWGIYQNNTYKKVREAGLGRREIKLQGRCHRDFRQSCEMCWCWPGPSELFQIEAKGPGLCSTALGVDWPWEGGGQDSILWPGQDSSTVTLLHFGPDNSLLAGKSCSMYYRMVSNLPSLYLLNASRILSLTTGQSKSLQTLPMSPRGISTPSPEPLN